jgi:hypothetical protein
VGHLQYWELYIAYQEKLLHEWDQTSQLATLIDGLTATVSNLASKTRIKPSGKSPQGCPWEYQAGKADQEGLEETGKEIPQVLG